MTYDAKDRDTAFPPIEPLLPPDGPPSVLVGTTVTPDHTPRTSRITWVPLDVGTDGHDHLVSPDERLRVDMARQ